MLEAIDPVVLGRMVARAHDAAGGGLVERLDQEGRLAPAGHPGHGGKDAERDRGGDVLQVVAARADDFEFPLLLRLAPFRGHSDFEIAGEILSGDRVRVGHDLVGLALGDHLAAMHAGSRADIDHIVGSQDRILVMLDHDHRIADVAQMLERIEQPGVVALVQADRRLVEHVEHASQARTDLRGQPDALALAARQRAGVAAERQVVETDVVEEAQPLTDLLEDADGNIGLLFVQRFGQRLVPVAGLADRHLGHFADMQAVDLDGQRFGLEAVAVACRAGGGGHVALDLLARPCTVRFLPAALEIGDHTLERLGCLVGAQTVVVTEFDLFLRSVEDRLLRLRWQLRPLVAELEAEMLAERFQRLCVIRRGRARPRRDRAAADNRVLVRDHQRFVDLLLAAETVTGGAGAVRIVEGEQPRLDLGDREARNRAGEFLREQDALMGFVERLVGRSAGRRLGFRKRFVGEFRNRQTIGERQAGFQTVGEARGHVLAYHHAIHDHVDIVLELLVERGHVGDLVKLAVDLHALKALFHQVGEFLAVLALPSAHHRREDIETAAFLESEHAVHHLAHRLALDRQAGRR